MSEINILLSSNETFHIKNFCKLSLPDYIFLRIFVIHNKDEIMLESKTTSLIEVPKTNENIDIQEVTWKEATKIEIDIFIGHSRDFINDIFFEEIWKSNCIKKFLLIRDLSDSIEIRHRCIELEIKFKKLVFSIFENRVYLILEKAFQSLANIDKTNIFRCSLWSKYHSENRSFHFFTAGEKLILPNDIREFVAQDQIRILKFLFGSIIELKEFNIEKNSIIPNNSLTQDYFISEKYSNLIESILIDQNYWPPSHGGEIIYNYGQISWDWNKGIYTSLSRSEGLSVFDLTKDTYACDSFTTAWDSIIRNFLGFQYKD